MRRRIRINNRIVKGQVSTELLLMISASFAIGIVLISGISYSYSELLQDKGIEIANEIVISVENELFSASKMLTGYTRTFNIPDEINGANYSISLLDEDIILTYNDIDFYGVAPNSTGTLGKGNNIIKNINGRVCINLANC